MRSRPGTGRQRRLWPLGACNRAGSSASAPAESLRDGLGCGRAGQLAGLSGFDVLSSPEAPEVALGEVAVGDPAAFEAARIEAGVPVDGSRAHGQDDPARGRRARRAHGELHQGLLHRPGARRPARCPRRERRPALAWRRSSTRAGSPEAGATLSLGRARGGPPHEHCLLARAHDSRSPSPMSGATSCRRQASSWLAGETPAEIRELPLEIR